MNNFVIVEAAPFEEKFGTLTLVEKERVEKFIIQLRANANMIGKPLGYFFFREKKFNGKRLYFLVYEEWKAVLVITISGKKDQPETILAIKSRLPLYREYIYQKLKEIGVIST